MTEQRLPLPALPPLPMVRELGESLDASVPRTILDAGTGTGRNAQYLARLGHTVFSLDSDATQLQAIRESNQFAGIDVPTLHFVTGDVQRLPFGLIFDIGCMNELNLQMSKTATHKALAELRRVTVPGGLNIVSGYLLAPREGTVRNRARAFVCGELGDIYVNAGWSILSYREELLPLQYSNAGKEVISSLTKIVARRPKILGLPTTIKF